MVNNIRKKNAIAMIELIFALVIMGIVLMSAPMLIQQSIKSSNVALQQEAIVAAASQTAIVLSMHWDENNTHAGGSMILNTPGFTNFPPDGLNGVAGRDIGAITSSPSALGRDLIPGAGEDFNETTYTQFDDVDDYQNQPPLGLMLFNTESATADLGEYVDTNVSIATTVRYTQENNVSVNALLASSNVKAIQVRLTSNLDDTKANYVAELEKDITFEAFSCNIGTYFINGRVLP